MLGVCYADEVYTHTEAAQLCASTGARLCTLEELNNDVAKGTGCRIDYNMVWTDTSCPDGSYRVTGGSTRRVHDDFACHATDEASYAVRCCSDVVILPPTLSPTLAPTTPSAAPTTAEPTDAPTPAPTLALSPTITARFEDHSEHLGLIPSECNWEAQGMVMGRKLYYFGGFDSNWEYMYNDSYAFDVDTMSWAKLADMPLVDGGYGTTHCGQTTYSRDNAVILIGGLQVSRNPVRELEIWPHATARAEVYKYWIDTDTWTQLAPIPGERGGGGAAVLEDTLYFVGGSAFGFSTEGYHAGMYTFIEDFADLWSLDMTSAASQWVSLSPMEVPRNHIGTIMLGDAMYVIGGQSLELEGCTNKDAVERYDPATDTWQMLSPLPFPLGHIAPSTLSVGREGIFVIGGVTNTRSGSCDPPGDDVETALFYNPLADRWDVIAFPDPGASMVAGIVDDHVYYITREMELKRVAFDVYDAAQST